MRHRRMLLMAGLCLWLFAAGRPAAGTYRCTATGVEAQDNFEPVRQGHYCTTSPGDAQAVCGDDHKAIFDCTARCSVCGGTITSASCQWEGSPSPGDAYATTWGCTSTQYGQFYREVCGCNYPPPPSCGENCNGDPDCEACECNGQDWLYDAEGVPHCESPILIDLSSNSAQYHLTSAADGVVFDIDGDGTKEKISWTPASSSVTFLAMDRNDNGQIDDGTELFGNRTRKRDGTLARNGFEALADLADSGAGDKAITAADSIYARLLIWNDWNHNGLSEPSELTSLTAAGITRIETSYMTKRRRDQYGNRYRFESTAIIVEKDRATMRRVFDVFFVVAR